MALTKDGIKNLIDVLKTTNLTMTAVCLGLISNVILSWNSLSQRALDDLNELQLICERSKELSVREVVKTCTLATNPQMLENEKTLKLDSSAKTFDKPVFVKYSIVRFLVPKLFTGVKTPSELEKRDAGIATTRFGDFDNLEDLGRAWDLLSSISSTVLIADVPFEVVLHRFNDDQPGNVTLGEVEFEAINNSPPDLPNSGEVVFGEIENDPRTTVEGIILDKSLGTNLGKLSVGKDGWADYLSWLEKYFLVVKFSATNVPVNPLAALLKNYSSSSVDPSRLKARSFEKAYPNLAELGAHYRSLKLVDLHAILSEESKRSKGDLELFGTKIPAGLFVVLGIPLLGVLLLQFYSVSVYLAREGGSLDEEQASQWSFLLRGLGFVLFGLFTTLLLPIAATVLSIFFVTKDTWYKWWLWGPIGAGVLMASFMATVALYGLRACVIGSQSRIIRSSSDH